MIKIFTLLYIFIGVVSIEKTMAQTPVGLRFEKYCNQPANFCVDFPKDILFQRHKSPTGVTFKNKDETAWLTCFTWRNWDSSKQRELSVKEQYDYELSHFTKNNSVVVDNKKLSTNYYVISGHYYISYPGKQTQALFYYKVIVKQHAFCEAVLQFPQSQQKEFSEISQRVFESFH